jgi:prepilin-type N-terminal cleavage/methylation domain-containing protein
MFMGNRGFSLLEATVVIIILTILASAAIPVLSRSFIEKAANKTALDMSAIEEAARAFYIDNNKWPDNSAYPTAIAALQAGNYLPSAWNAVNPFGASSGGASGYAYSTSSNASSFTVYTFVPASAAPMVQNLLPTSSMSAGNVYSSIPVPGALSILPAGSILPWASGALPKGYLWCNGQSLAVSSYPALFAAIGTIYGGDGVNGFNLPDLRARTIVGVDGMGEAGLTNRITLWGTLPNGFGGTFGESAHTLSMAELPANAFNVQAFMANGSHLVGIQGSNNGANFQTTSSNMNLGSGSAHNVVQPSMAMGYIIKY